MSSVCYNCDCERSEAMGSSNRVNIAKDNPSIIFDSGKCDECGICKNICKFNVGVYGYNDEDYPCINCGSCTIMCPNKCLSERDETDKLDEYLHSGKKVIFQTAPAVRVSLGEEFGLKPGTNVEGKLVSAIRAIGGNYVFDTTFGADLTVMEEANELVNRIKSNIRGPMFTSCCPSWVKFIESFYPEYIPNLSTCKSPISMQGAIIKNYFSRKTNIDKEDIISIAITPCTAKKMEILKFNDIDLAITVREFARYLKKKNIDFNNLKNSSYNSLMSKGSGGGVIFGTSGGVTESIIREVYHILNNRKPSKKLLNFKEVRGLSNVKEAEVTISDITLNIAVINGTGDARKVIEKIKKGEAHYDFIEVMACEGGCISGGGQPRVYPSTNELKTKRMKGLYKSDKKMKIRNASDNPDIIKVYDEFLGVPLSDISEKYLHTSYINRKEE